MQPTESVTSARRATTAVGQGSQPRTPHVRQSSRPSLDFRFDLCRSGDLQHTLNVDVTSYADGVRSTLPAKDGSPEGVADAAYVWKHFEAGCSVRMLHPQRWCDALWKVCFWP